MSAYSSADQLVTAGTGLLTRLLFLVHGPAYTFRKIIFLSPAYMSSSVSEVGQQNPVLKAFRKRRPGGLYPLLQLFSKRWESIGDETLQSQYG